MKKPLTILSFSLGAMALGASAVAQSTPAPPAITRTVIVATKLSTVTDVPLYFKAVSVTLPSGEKTSVSAANGIVYQISGSTEISLDGETKMLNAGEGLFIAGGKTSVLKPGSGGASSFLHFLLAPAAGLDRPAESAPAAVRELYRTAAPIPPQHHPYGLFCVAPGHQLGFNDLKTIEVAEFLEAVAGGEKRGPDFREAWEIQKIIDTAVRSSKLGTWQAIK